MKSLYVLLLTFVCSFGLAAAALLPAGAVLQNTSASDALQDEAEMNDDEDENSEDSE